LNHDSIAGTDARASVYSRTEAVRPIADSGRERGDPMSLPSACSLAVACGILFYCAFPTVGIWPLAFIAATPLVAALEGQRLTHACVIGLCAGLVMNTAGFWWIVPAGRSFSQLPEAALVPLALGVWTYQAGQFALLGGAYACLRARGWPSGLVFPLCFAAAEFLFPKPIPWCFAACVHDVPLLLQTAELAGPQLTAMVLIVPGVALGSVLIERCRSRGAYLRAAGMLTLPVLLAVAHGASSLKRVEAAVAAAPEAHVGVVHDDSPRRLTEAQRSRRLALHLQLTEELRKRNVDFVIWSETILATTTSPQARGVALGPEIAGRTGIPLVLGATVDDGSARYNSALSTDAAGFVTGRYDKQKLFALGEYVPWGDVFPSLYGFFPFSGRYTRGAVPDPLTVLGHNLTALICFEDTFPEHVNRMVAETRPGMLVTLANDGWFRGSPVRQIHLALAQLRAVEHRRFLLRATNAGVSAVIHPTGRVVASTDANRAELLEARVSWLDDSKTLFELLGDAPWYAVTALLLGMALRGLAYDRGRAEKRCPALPR